MIVMHIDANSAFLSWTAVGMLKNGSTVDIRNIPSVIAGNPENRHGIILAKSLPAKKFGIVTGESLFAAMKKCPQLQVFPPDYELYESCSNDMFDLISQYSPVIQRYSIDECFLDYTGLENHFGDPVECACKIKDRIKSELGFTVNIGVSVNKLLAKMGSEMEKPDKVHSLFPEEIESKMWPLPVDELFMVGHNTAEKLKKINITTIGDLAHCDSDFIRSILKSHGDLIQAYANGHDESPVVSNTAREQKGISNSVTLSHDVKDRDEALKILLALTEKATGRLRKKKKYANVVSINITNSEFFRYAHQLKLDRALNNTNDIFKVMTRLFDETWKGEPFRLLGVSLTDFTDDCVYNMNFLEQDDTSNQNVDDAIETIRSKFGNKALVRGVFINGNDLPKGRDR